MPSLGVLVSCAEEARERDGELRLVGVQGSPAKVIALTGLDSAFTIGPRSPTCRRDRVRRAFVFARPSGFPPREAMLATVRVFVGGFLARYADAERIDDIRHGSRRGVCPHARRRYHRVDRGRPGPMHADVRGRCPAR